VLDVRKGERVLVEGLDWLGASRPTLDDVRGGKALLLDHHAWRSAPNRHFVDGSPPPSFEPLGVIKPTSRERATRCSSWGSWEAFPLQCLLEWRWKHDRKTLLAEEAFAEAERAKRAAAAARKHEARRARQTLGDLRRRPFFSSWSDRRPAAVVRASRALVRAAIDRLTELGPRARESAKMKVFNDCVEAFNRLDEENGHFIETSEREDLCEQLEAIAHAGGLGHRADEVHAARDW
jgi:hypothetical protein